MTQLLIVILDDLTCMPDLPVQEIMKPRTDISAVAADTPLAQVLDLARQRGYTRYPVYEGDLDHIVGVVHVKEMSQEW